MTRVIVAAARAVCERRWLSGRLDVEGARPFERPTEVLGICLAADPKVRKVVQVGAEELLRIAHVRTGVEDVRVPEAVGHLCRHEHIVRMEHLHREKASVLALLERKALGVSADAIFSKQQLPPQTLKVECRD